MSPYEGQDPGVEGEDLTPSESGKPPVPGDVPGDDAAGGEETARGSLGGPDAEGGETGAGRPPAPNGSAASRSPMSSARRSRS